MERYVAKAIFLQFAIKKLYDFAGGQRRFVIRKWSEMWISTEGQMNQWIDI